jgi:GTP cyclohydrolase IA
MSSFTDFQTAIYKMLEAIPGEDVGRPGLSDTPERVAKLFLNELTHGYVQNINNVISHSIYDSDNKDMIVIKDIPFYSICEHHFIPFFGQAAIGYVPRSGKVLDTGKFGRVVDIYSKRFQTQETLTAQIADALFHGKLNPVGVGVYIEAEHLCAAMRGARKQNTKTITSTLRGSFVDNPITKQEWINITNK